MQEGFLGSCVSPPADSERQECPLWRRQRIAAAQFPVAMSSPAPSPLPDPSLSRAAPEHILHASEFLAATLRCPQARPAQLCHCQCLVHSQNEGAQQPLESCWVLDGADLSSMGREAPGPGGPGKQGRLAALWSSLRGSELPGWKFWSRAGHSE